MAYQQILCETADRVTTITLNRPNRLNAFTGTIASELRQALTAADQDDDVRAIIVTGAGRAFCAGADLENFNRPETEQPQTSDQHTKAVSLAESANRRRGISFAYMMSLHKPIIGAINGYSVGIGFVLSLFFDIRIAAESSRMAIIFPQRGLALESGSSWLLPRIIGLGRAMELATTGRMFGAKEALEMGLVSYVTPDNELMEKAREVAQFIAVNCAPVSVAESRRQVFTHLFADFDTADREDERVWRNLFKSEDCKEAFEALAAKRKPQWKGR